MSVDNAVCDFALGFAEKQKLSLKFVKSEYAYGLYLWGFVVQQCLIQKCYVESSILPTPNFLFIASFFVTYVLAMVSYNFVYVPFSKWNKKLVTYLQER